KAVLLGAGGVGKVGAAKICIHRQFSLCNGIGPPQDQGGTGGQHSLPAGSHRLLRLPQAAVLAVGQHLPAARGQYGGMGAAVCVVQQHQFGPAAAGTGVVQPETGSLAPRPPDFPQPGGGGCAFVGQGGQQRAQGHQAPVVVGQVPPGGGPGAGPVQPVQSGGRGEAVPQALLGTAHLLPRKQEPPPLAAEAESGGQPVGPQDGGGGGVKFLAGVHGDHQLVPQGPVVVAGKIADGLAGGLHGEPAALHAGPAGNGVGQ